MMTFRLLPEAVRVRVGFGNLVPSGSGGNSGIEGSDHTMMRDGKVTKSEIAMMMATTTNLVRQRERVLTP